MAVETVREALVRGSDQPSVQESDIIEISWDETSTPPEFSDIPTYPFSGQQIIRGEYKYESNPRFGSPETSEGSLQIRTGSGLMLVRTERDRPKPSKIVSAIEETLNGGFEIGGSFVPNQQKVWDFIDAANKVIDLKVYTPHGEVKRAEEIASGNVEQFSPKIADIRFDHNGESVEVEYRDNRLSINSDNEELREYVIQIFESTIFDA
ncbi:hypothetical protein [Haloarcula sebkhae]|uniref:Uncharacterized protein n=2 Tax=Haloarcula sebkhae TaxID=932660 RepID=A0ACC6VH80_9EURY|nr:hypothetical protein [Haloarcula sebkhae]GGK56628.1 hypothetical protein GCM10009067_06350 [Haloarcula sebkhae]